MRLGGNQKLETSWEEIAGYENAGRDFPGGPIVGTLCFYCRDLGFHSWLGNWNPTSRAWRLRNLGVLLCFCFVSGHVHT